MEKEKTQTESAEPKEMVRKLTQEIHRDLLRQRFYGMDLKLKALQKALSLSTRI